MKNVTFYSPVEVLNYSGMVKIGSVLQLAGQGGWNDKFEFLGTTLEEEINIACDNIERVLNEAGATWENVVTITSYHVGGMDEATPLMVGQFKKRISSHMPVWTGVGVESLGLPDMKVEIVVTAVLNESK